jgi:nucleoside-diphosphate-sugar epimerase
MKNKFTFLEEDIQKINSEINFSEMKNKSILITGATGLIGTYLLLSLNNIIDNLNISITIIHNSPIDEVFKEIINFEKINCINEDITNIDKLEKLLDNYDYIIHSAGYGQPSKFLQNQLKTLELNTTSTFFLFNKLKKNGKFLFISSSEVYFDNENQIESLIGYSTPEHERACYIEGKRCGETICNIYRKNEIDAKSVRLSLTYGPGTKKNDQRMLTNFIQKAIEFNKIKLLDDGKGIRTYLYVADATIMIWNIFLNGKENVYNVGGQEKYTIFELANKISKLMNVEVEVGENNSLLGSPKSVNLNMSRYQSEFGELKLNELNNGLNKTIEWQKIIYQK